MTLEIDIATQHFIDQGLEAEIKIAELQRAAPQRSPADLVQVRRARRMTPDVISHRGEAQHLHDLFLDIEVGRHVGAQRLELQPRPGFIARRQGAMRGIEPCQQSGMSAVEHR
jgi:hypothetical protein